MNTQKFIFAVSFSPCDNYMNNLYLKHFYAVLYDFCTYFPINIKKSYEISYILHTIKHIYELLRPSNAFNNVIASV